MGIEFYLELKQDKDKKVSQHRRETFYLRGVTK